MMAQDAALPAAWLGGPKIGSMCGVLATSVVDVNWGDKSTVAQRRTDSPNWLNADSAARQVKSGGTPSRRTPNAPEALPSERGTNSPAQ